MRKVIGIIILTTLLLISGKAIAAPKVIVNGEQIICETQPVIVDGRVLVPLRDIFKSLNVSVDWNEKSYAVTAQKNNRMVIILDQRIIFGA